MKMKVQKIRFQGLDFILTSPDDIQNTPIATIDTYSKGECSYAHLRNGSIFRFNNQIGTIEDIEFGEEIEIEIDALEAFAGLLGDSW